MTVFLVIGGVGLVFLLLSLIVGDWLEGVFGALEVDLDGGGLISGPVLGAFAAAFGLGGAAVLSTTDAPLVVAALGGLLTGLVIGYLAWRVTKALMHMPTDEPVRTADLLGKSGRVVTPIPANGLGEILVRHAGQPLKLSGRAPQALPAGTAVIITQIISTSSVEVAAEDDLFGTERSQ
jgi:membrane protein implicated in regulation of membrane protease activity